MEFMKVRNLENKNQFIMENEKEIIFQSYDSIIAIVNKKSGVIVLGRDWDYSKTTMKHLYLFIDNEITYNENLKELFDTKYSNNRRKSIQQLIDNNKIQYSEKLV